MSEAMSSVEIEDVLSSIRRLVSDDLRPSARPPELKKAEPKAVEAKTAEPRTADPRTAELKTAEPKAADGKLILTAAFRVAPEVAVTPAKAAPLSRLHLGAEHEIEKLAATLERAVEAQDVEWESEIGDPAPHVSKMEWTEAGWATVSDGSAPVVPQPRAPEVPPSWAQAEPDPPEPAISVAPKPLFAEPDTLWADRAEAEAVADLRADVGAPINASPAEMTIDEQMIRDIVRDLIREELQGDMGERITRNVRKLVRAEIARVLATQDLE